MCYTSNLARSKAHNIIYVNNEESVLRIWVMNHYVMNLLEEEQKRKKSRKGKRVALLTQDMYMDPQFLFSGQMLITSFTNKPKSYRLG